MTAAVQRASEAPAKPRTLETLQFNNRFTRDLPADTKTLNRLREVEGAFYSWVEPTPTETEPKTLAVSEAVADLIGLDVAEATRPEFAAIFSGNAPLSGSKTYAQCYGGHQFGYWAGQLGDGRAICFGEVVNDQGEHWELQLKGAGKTPYSRMADGRAVLRSSLREFVASEAMAALGVPTTRALSLVQTGQGVYRDMFYNGNHKEEPGAVVCRVAQTFVRFGTFQLPCARGASELGLVKQLAEYVIRHHYPHIILDGDTPPPSTEEGEGAGTTKVDAATRQTSGPYLALLQEVAKRTARLAIEWHRVGFVHGVLNTDNMSIIGDTIDYGPYAFMERFDPTFTPNTTDLPGRRYCFKNQPGVCQWNLMMLAKAFVLAELIDREALSDVLDTYADALADAHAETMRRKLGLREFDPELYTELMVLMQQDATDYTNTWRALSSVRGGAGQSGLTPELRAALGGDELPEDRVAVWADWTDRYRAALSSQGLPYAEQRAMQDAVNPALIPRNHVLVDLIAEVERGELNRFNAFLDALKKPYDDAAVEAAWKLPAPREARLGIELLSCSS